MRTCLSTLLLRVVGGRGSEGHSVVVVLFGTLLIVFFAALSLSGSDSYRDIISFLQN